MKGLQPIVTIFCLALHFPAFAENAMQRPEPPPVPGMVFDAELNGHAIIDPFRYINININKDSIGTTQLKKSVQSAEKGEWPQAVASIQKLVESNSPSLVDLNQSGHRWAKAENDAVFWSLPKYARWRLSRLPPEGIEAYRALVDATARAAFDRALKKEPLDEEKVRQLIDKYYISSSTEEAIEQLGDLAFQNGRLQAAADWYRQLVTVPSIDSPDLSFPTPSAERAPRIFAKYLLVRYALGEAPLRDTGARLFLERFPHDPGGTRLFGRGGEDRAGRPVPLSRILDQALNEDHFDAFASLESSPVGVAGVLPQRADDFPSLGLPFHRQNASLAGWDTGGNYPSIADEKLWLFNGRKLLRLDLRDGKHPSPQLWFESNVPSENGPVAVSSGLAVFRLRADSLIALSTQRAGDVRWNFHVEAARPALSKTLIAGPLAIESAPLAVGHRIFVSIVQRSQSEAGPEIKLTDLKKMRRHFLVVLNAESGRVETAIPIGQFTWGESGLARAWARPTYIRGPAFHDLHVGRQCLGYQDGAIFYQSNDGLLMAVDASTLAPMWLRQYTPSVKNPPLRPSPPPFHAPFVSRGLLATIPADSDTLFVLDAKTGISAWEKRLPGTGRLRVAGFQKNRVVVSGPTLTVYDVATKQSLWEIAAPAEHFLVTATHVVASGPKGVMAFALDTGTPVSAAKGEPGPFTVLTSDRLIEFTP